MSFSVNEQSSSKYTATITDQDGVVVPYTALTSLVLTLINKADLSIINNRSNQNVLNDNDVTIDVDGLVTWQMRPADNVIVNDATATERHIAIFKAVWAAGARGVVHRVEIDVANIEVVV